MTAGNWLILSLYILIPSAVTFFVLFGIWRLASWMIHKFHEFVYKYDRRGLAEQNIPSVSRKKPSSKGFSDDWEDSIPIHVTKTVSSGTYDSKTGERITDKLQHTEYEMPLEEVKKLSQHRKQTSR
jgi:hypothetical protein